MNSDRFWSASLRAAPWGGIVTRVLAAGLAAVEPAAAIGRHMQRDGDLLLIGERTYNLNDYERIFVVGAGKAGRPMAAATAAILADRLSAGVVIYKDDPAAPTLSATGPVALLAAGHPLPDDRGVAAAGRIADLLSTTGERDLVIALISGGGSALLTLPVAGVSLSDLQALTGALLASGAGIDEINCLRKHLDQLKGGGLARLAYPAALVSLALSDVVGSPLDVIASGPTVPDSSSFADAWAVIERYNLASRIPASIETHLRRGVAGEIAENPRAGDPCFAHSSVILIGENAQAAEAAAEAARAEGLQPLILSTYLQGEAREAGRFLAAILREIAAHSRPLARPACLIVGGETTVTLRGAGQGGRNQELALAAVHDLADLPNIALVTLASDGGDGPTDAAGVVVTGESLWRAQSAGLSPSAHLANNDAYHFFAALGDLLRPGPTDTNVNDLAFLFAF